MLYLISPIFAFLLTFLVLKWKAQRKRKKALRLAVAARLQERENSIEKVRERLIEVADFVKQRIGELDLDTLIQKLQNGEFTAVQVLRTYQERAIRSHEQTNCITLFIEEADEWAKELDEKASDTNYRRPPFFGVPFSVKECVNVAGYDHTRGYAHELGNIALEDSLLIQRIKQLGGIPFVLTNVPQSLLTYSCSNPIYGTTSNAFAKDRTSGGSSGGEGALIATGGSVIGIGGDVGGSLRYPCHFNGIAGLKPSHLRLSHRGTAWSVPGRPMVNSCDGPMAKSIASSITFFRAVWSNKWFSLRDPYVPPVDWDEKQFSDKRPLRIGYYTDDGWFKPTPALQRAVLETKERLESRGHTLVNFSPPDMTTAFQLFIGAVTADGGTYILNKIDQDLECEGYRLMLMIYRIPICIQRVLAFILAPIYPRLAAALSALPMNTSHMRSIFEAIEKYRERFIRRMQDEKIDAILCPVQVVPAIGHLYPMKLFSTTSYCGLFNLLDFAAGTTKVTTVTEQDEADLADYPESDPWYAMAKKATQGSVGLPVGVQVATPPYREETALRVLSEIEASGGAPKLELE